MLDCATSTIKKEGILGLYRGMAAPIVGIAPVFAISFAGYGFGQTLQKRNGDNPLTVTQEFYAGCWAGVFTTPIMVPGERIKCVLQLQGAKPNAPKFNGPVDLAKFIYKTQGIGGLYRGTLATLARDIPGSGAYFAGYCFFKKQLTPEGTDPSELSPLRVLFAGGMAGVCNWIVSTPPDVVKSRLQTAEEGVYKGTSDVIRQMIAKEGIASFYKGIGPVLVRAFPANAACFLGYETAMKVLNYLW